MPKPLLLRRRWSNPGLSWPEIASPGFAGFAMTGADCAVLPTVTAFLMPIRLSENFRALFYAPFYAAHAIGAYDAAGVAVELVHSPDPASTAAALLHGEID